MLSKLKEKKDKFFLYIKLHKMFSTENEFRRMHTPETVKLWEKKFRQMIRYSSDRTFPIVEEFLSAEIEKVYDAKGNIKREDLVLICVLKDDIDKLKPFMEHYRKRGISVFVFLDNMSTDGTFEYLTEQGDTVVYRCRHTFTADRKIAWVNRLIAEYGIDRWYLMVDSDEFFTYLGESSHTFQDVIWEAEQKKYKRLGVVHLDLYPKGSLFKDDTVKNFIQDYCYFDADTYTYGKTLRGMKIAGGPRKRVFGTDMKVSGYRMVYFEADDVVPSAHFMIPYEKSWDVPVVFVSKHYKFVNESDYQKMVEAVKTGMHSDNSKEYKTYYNALKDNAELSLYDEKHSVLFTEEAIRKIDFVRDIFEK